MWEYTETRKRIASAENFPEIVIPEGDGWDLVDTILYHGVSGSCVIWYWRRPTIPDMPMSARGRLARMVGANHIQPLDDDGPVLKPDWFKRYILANSVRHAYLDLLGRERAIIDRLDAVCDAIRDRMSEQQLGALPSMSQEVERVAVEVEVDGAWRRQGGTWRDLEYLEEIAWGEA